MTDLVKNSIDSRKNAIYNAYIINDSNLKKEIDDLFKKIDNFGNGYNDIMDFENNFAGSPLNQEYIELFTKIAQNCKPIINESNSISEESNNLNKEISSDIDMAIDDLTRPARRIAREETEKKLRNTPIIGNIMNVKQHLDLFGGFRRKKKAKEEQEKLRKELGLDEK